MGRRTLEPLCYPIHMEKELTISIPKTKYKIYAKQYGSLDRPVVIFVHGLTGHMDEHLFFNGARYFYQQGISSFRFNLYGAEDDERNLTDCTLQTHAHDLNIVINYLQTQKVKKLFAIGHSYGGPTILLANHNKFDAIVFWDASYNYRLDDSKELPKTKLRYLDWGVWPLIGDAMYKEAQTFDQKKLFNDFNTPIKVITAGKSYYEDRKKNYDYAKEPKAYYQVKDAGHTFTEEGKADELYKESLEWINKYI